MVIDNYSVIYTIQHIGMSKIKKNRKSLYTTLRWLVVFLITLKVLFIKLPHRSFWSRIILNPLFSCGEAGGLPVYVNWRL